MTTVLKELIRKAGMFQCGEIDPGQIRFAPEVRAICEANACRQYGKTWACPPAVGTLEDCARRIRAYDSMLLFSKKYALEDSFDLEGMAQSMHSFQASCRALDDLLQPHLTDYLLLSNEGCDLCAACTYPHAPCRFPARAHHALEGYGVYVSELAAMAGIRYHNGSNTVTFFGALVYHSAAQASAHSTSPA